MVSGMRATASASKKMLLSGTDVKGKSQHGDGHRADAHSNSATMGSPARWDNAMPPEAPMNMPGNVGHHGSS